MSYILRIIQRYRPEDRAAFLDLEAQFAAAEREPCGLSKGQRRQPHSGRQPVDTLIWEAQFPSLAALEAARVQMAASDRHTELFYQQAPLITEAYTEIDEVLEF
jgi:hypothetical protein